MPSLYSPSPILIRTQRFLKGPDSSMFDLAPTSVLFLLLVVLILQNVISAIGKSTLSNHCWNLYSTVASRAGKAKFVELSKKRSELVQINKDRKSISAQDQYAKWTKLNRNFDRVSADIKTLVEEVSSEKATVNKAVNMALSILTVAPVWFCRVWYRKTVLFYFPKGYFPHAMEWVLALPFTVTGGVGLTVWMYALNSFLSSIIFLIGYLIEPAVKKPVKPVELSEQATKN